MKRSLFLALWSAGALGSPCKPARDVTHNNYDLPPAPSTYLAPTQLSQETTVVEPPTTGGSADGDQSISSSIHLTETFTERSGSHTIGLPEESVTVDPVSPSETTVADGDIPEDSQHTDIPGVSGPQTSGNTELSDGGEVTVVPTNGPGQSGSDVTRTETTKFGGDDATQFPIPSTATDTAGEPSGDATNIGSGSEQTSATETANAPGQSDSNVIGTETSVLGDNATQLPASGTTTNVIGQPSDDTENSAFPSSNASSLADGVGATDTATGGPVETSGPGVNTDTSVDGTVPTKGAPGSVSTVDLSGDVTSSASITEGQSDATQHETDGTVDVPITTQNPDSTDTGSSGSPNETISQSGTDAQATDTETATAGLGNTSRDIVETTGIAPEQSSQIVPGITDINEETTGSDTGVSTEVDSITTGAVTNSETTVGSPEQTSIITEQTHSNGSSETTDLESDHTSVVDATTTEGAQSDATDASTKNDTDGEVATTQSIVDNSDTTAVEASSDDDRPSTAIGITTSDAATVSDGNNETPSTTAPNGNSPSVTSTPVPVTTTSAVDAPFPTVTDAPEGFATSTVSDHPEWISNTWITTTSGDSSEPTIVPVLVGCKQCGGSGSGIILWNFPKTPDTWFKLPGLPKFTFPCIPPGCSTPPTTSESNNEDDDDDDEEPSSTSCTDKATVTDCFVACTTYTGPAGASITPECSTTCTATHTGCSVTGTTTTSSAAACGPSGDSSCSKCTRRLVSDTDPEALERRSFDLEKRGPRKAPKMIGGCKFNQQPAFPEYPGGGTVLDNDAVIIPKGSPFKDIKKWWLATIDNQCLPVLRGNLNAATYKRDSSGGDSDRPSIDHVYEKNMILQFFNEIIDPNGPAVRGATSGGPRDKINCQDMQAYGGATSRNKKKLLQKVFDAYPGAIENRQDVVMVTDAHYMDDLIGMDQWTNGDAKAHVANPIEVKAQGNKWTGSQFDVTALTGEDDAWDWINTKLDWLERMAIGVEMFSATEAINALIRQNQRIYARLMDIDNNAKNCMNDPAVKNNLWSFADAYKKFMATRFNGQDSWSINNEVADAKTKLINKLRTDLAAAVNVKAADAAGWKDDIATFNRRLNNMDDASRQWAVPEPAWVWTWIKKRDGEDPGLSCDRPIPSDTTTSEEPTTFATSTRTSSEESSSEESTSSVEETSSSEEMITSTTEDSVQLTDFPTLTNAPPLSISTPDGSSCASTTTYTQCNLGTGNHGGACVTNSQCASWINTEATSTTPTPTPTMESPDPSQNIKHCYNDGPKVSYDSITVNAESFCNKVVSKNKDNGYYWSNDKLEEKLLPGGGGRGYHFKALFEVKEGCLWKADFDECMRYMKVPIDSCDCSAKGNKQGGWVENNCITAKIDPNKGD